MITPMLRPDLFGGLATHAGDALYEFCYIPEFAKAVRALREYDGSIDKWWKDFQGRVAFTKDADETLLMTLGVSACFSADQDGTPVLPFDPETGRLRYDIWQRWLDWDPVRMVPDHAEALTRSASDLDRRREERRVVFGNRRTSISQCAHRDRRRRCPLRIVRRYPRPDRIPVPDVARLPGRTTFVNPLSPASICLSVRLHRPGLFADHDEVAVAVTILSAGQIESWWAT